MEYVANEYKSPKIIVDDNPVELTGEVLMSVNVIYNFNTNMDTNINVNINTNVIIK